MYIAHWNRTDKPVATVQPVARDTVHVARRDTAMEESD